MFTIATRPDKELQATPEEIGVMTAVFSEISRQPPIDTNDPQQVEDRIRWYFDRCATTGTRPGVAGLSLALGVNRSTLWRWRNERTRGKQHQQAAENAYGLLEALWEQYMLTGKINPVTGIFIAKNNFGYADRQEFEVSPKQNALTAGLSTPEEIAARYAQLPGYDDE